MHDIEEILVELQRFSWPDYVAFVAMFLLCICIGIYFGFMNKSVSEADYMLGGRKMLVIPIAFSLVASFISGITLLGLPTEVYSYGVQYLYVAFGVVGMGIVMGVFYLPVFHDLNITSTYEYLEVRFDRRLRLYGSIMFAVMNVAYLPIVIYVPALAFNQVTGIGVHTITPIVCIICVFYTSLGGLKAVVWTDVVQAVSMLGALCLVAIKGSIDIGGVSVVLERAWNTDRLEAPDLSIDPTVRHTFWCLFFGGIVYWTQTNAVSQNMIQRYLALPTLADARKALFIFCVGVLILMALCGYNGLLIYATYQNCDPLTTKLAKARDQLLPLFVMDTLGELPGMTGLFIAGVFSAALSSLSTCLNSMSAVVLEDFVKPYVKQPLSSSSINWIMRLVVVGVGALCVCLVYVVEHMGTVLQLTMSLEAITNGPLFGIFTIGLFLPWINGNSALLGGIMGVIAMSWVSLNAQWAIASGAISYNTKPLNIEQCDYRFNLTATSAANSSLHLAGSATEDIFPLYRISYMWYTTFGASITIIVALLGSLAFGRNNPNKVDPVLLTPCIRRFFSFGSDKPLDAYKPDIPLQHKLRNDEVAL
ncbi:sodium-coupled monocarboxylate transporter 1 [Drosophila guanche]|uniref:Blast:Sodium-coupled monocarboxylate transporter 1 n=1 Tax=Drosophila guanche TaxID=7266 RepID=A0A3B0KJA3_DROGU|nr:sodium-coupled monocarboxylate transporter 1 [Drosophila guanche]SPP83838.1 blast:Sodium-coupled monocarboxylate transporter 1 [Drosophila guanche]